MPSALTIRCVWQDATSIGGLWHLQYQWHIQLDLFDESYRKEDAHTMDLVCAYLLPYNNRLSHKHLLN
jgi:hypothetical protein